MPSCEEIKRVYDEIENGEPDISTERLLQMVCDRLHLESCAVVVDGLHEFAQAVFKACVHKDITRVDKGVDIDFTHHWEETCNTCHGWRLISQKPGEGMRVERWKL